jgi:hypothetical protein
MASRGSCLERVGLRVVAGAAVGLAAGNLTPAGLLLASTIPP